MTAQIQVVKRDSMPPLREVVVDGVTHAIGEVRDFRVSQELCEFMPDSSEFSVSWARLGALGTHHQHVHPVQSIMVICEGSGELIGDLRCSIANGDVIVVPAGCLHGFIAGPEGLAALSIQFGDALYAANGRPRALFLDPDPGSNLESLVAYSQDRLRKHSAHRLLDLVRRGARNPLQGSPVVRQHLDDWNDMNLRLNCYRTARASVLEQSRSAGVIDVPGASERSNHHPSDTISRAIYRWFLYQMVVLDEVERTVLAELVVAQVNSLYDDFTGCPSGFRPDVLRDDLLRQQTSQTYKRLNTLLRDAWDMVDALADRTLALAVTPASETE